MDYDWSRMNKYFIKGSIFNFMAKILGKYMHNTCLRISLEEILLPSALSMTAGTRMAKSEHRRHIMIESLFKQLDLIYKIRS